MMRMVDVIDHKRNGGALTNEEIKFFVDGVVDGSILTTKPVPCLWLSI